MSGPVQLSTDAPIARLTLDRAESRNALSLDLLAVMHDAVETLGSSGARVVVITGAGRAFCAGMDLKAVIVARSGDETLGANLLRSLAELTLKIRALPMVTIASVNGAAIGGGCGLACVCDLCVSHEDAKLGFPEVDLGLCPAVIAPWVVKKLGASRARSAMLMGGVMSGAQARDIGLVDHLAADRDALGPLTDEVADRIAGGGAAALSATKTLLNTIDGSDNERVVLEAAELSAQVLRSPEAQAALDARMGPDKD